MSHARDLRVEKSEREDKLLSDLLYHEGWPIVERMLAEWDKGTLDSILAPAETEWQAIKKDGVLQSVYAMRAFFSQLSERAERYRRKVKMK